LSPVLQWLVIPAFAFFWALRAAPQDRSGGTLLILAGISSVAEKSGSVIFALLHDPIPRLV
jgi:hypothetical protein